MEYYDFASWIKQSGSLFEYLCETICPMQWLAYSTIEKLCSTQQCSTNRDNITREISIIGSQQSVSTLIFDTDRTLKPIITEDKQLWRKQQRRCSLCCFGCRKSRKIREMIYSFEK